MTVIVVMARIREFFTVTSLPEGVGSSIDEDEECTSSVSNLIQEYL